MRDEVRIQWVDTAKGIGIVLVVIGHTHRALFHGGVIDWSPAFKALDSWIYTFHMPLFFFLSGLFLTNTGSKSYSWFLTDKLRSIAYPYFIWSTITILLKTMLGSSVNQPRSLDDLPLILITPFEQFWFLYILLLGVILVGSLYRFGLNAWSVVLLACIVQLFSFQWSALHLLKRYLIYIALGGAIGIGRLSFTSTYYLGAMVVIGFSTPLFLQAQPFAALAGTAATIALAILIRDTWTARILSFLGLHSLEIYVCHAIVSASIRLALLELGVDSPLVHITMGITSGLIVPIGFSLAPQSLGFRYAFTIPKTHSGERPEKASS